MTGPICPRCWWPEAEHKLSRVAGDFYCPDEIKDLTLDLPTMKRIRSEIERLRRIWPDQPAKQLVSLDTQLAFAIATRNIP